MSLRKLVTREQNNLYRASAGWGVLGSRPRRTEAWMGFVIPESGLIAEIMAGASVTRLVHYLKKLSEY